MSLKTKSLFTQHSILLGGVEMVLAKHGKGA